VSKPVIFSDVDGTICFHQEANGIVEHQSLANGLINVSDPRNGICFETHDVSTSSYKIYLAEETRAHLHRVKETHDIVLVTGGRPSTCQRRSGVLDFAKAIVAENGAVIFDADFNRDEEWWDKLAPQRELLAEVRSYIRSYDWSTDDEGRSSAIRVRLRDNPHKNEEKFARLLKSVRLPEGLKSTVNLGNLDIVPAMAGKDHAISYLMKKWGVGPEQSFGIGDDINDTPFLKICGRSYVLSSAYPAVLEEAKREGWSISAAPTFEGIHEILRDIENGS
jgi:HAD superfamily hydrolase (TIGR01484 family)